jgi:MFS family permease
MPTMGPRFVLGASICLHWISLSVYLPILPTYARDIGASYEMIGIIVGAYGFTQMALRLPLGIASDRHNKSRVFLVAGAVLCIVSGLGMWLVRDVAALLVFRMLAGVAATVWVVQSVLYASHYPPAEAAKAMGVVSAAVNGGDMLAMLIGGLVAEVWGQEQVFLLAAVMGLAALACSLAVREPVALRPGTPFRPAEVAIIARDRGLALASVLGLILMMMAYATALGFVPLVAKNLGASYLEIGMLPTLFMLPSVVASGISGTVLLRLCGQRALLAGGLALMAFSCLAVPFVGSLAALFVFQVIGGTGRGIMFPLLLGLSISSVAADRKGTAMGFYQTAYGMGMFVGPLMAGALSEAAGLDWGFWAVGLIGVAGTAVALAVSPEPKAAGQAKGA